MNLITQWVTHARDGQPMRAYLAVPAAARSPLPAVLVIQEIWGPDAHIQDVTERLATAGYAALAPDLYSRGGRAPVLAPERVEAVKAFLDTVPPAAWADRAALDAALAREGPRAQQLGETMGALFAPRDSEGAVLDLLAWAEHLADAPASRGMPLAAIGFCMGGALAFTLATRLERLGAALVFYGAAPPPEDMNRIRCPVHGFYGGEDRRITGALPAVRSAMEAAGRRFLTRVYPGAGHAFFNDTRRSYDLAAARDAWARSLSVLAETLAQG